MAAEAAEMLRLPARRREQTVVTLTADVGEVPLSERIHLLTHAFAQSVRGARLRRVLEYDLIGGRVRFVLKGKARPLPCDGISVNVEHLPAH